MIDGLQPYPAYRNAGVDEVGLIPEHWQAVRLGAIGAFLKGSGGSKDDEVPDGVPCIRYGDLYTQHEFFIRRTRSFVTAERAAAYTPVERGDVLFAGSGETFEDIGKSAVVLMDPPVVAGGDVHILRPTREFVPEYLGLVAGSAQAVAQKAGMGVGVTVKHVYPGDLKDLWIPVPSLEEQAAAVRFIDHADRLIRRYIGAKLKLIKVLEEDRQVTIRRVVARGLGPDVRLQPSGVEWIGDVPEHWGVRQVRRVTSLVTSGSRGWAEFYRDAGSIFLQSGNLGRSMGLSLTHIQHVAVPPGAEGERTLVKRDDVLVCITGALTGNVALVDVDLADPAFVNQHVALVRPNETLVYPRYLAFALHSDIGRDQFKTGEYGGTKQGLGLMDVKSAFVPLPPLSEQIAICGDLDGKLGNLERAKERAAREIDLVREFRTRLIADVATGKLDVRAAAAALLDDDGEAEGLNDGSEDDLDQADVTDDPEHEQVA